VPSAFSRGSSTPVAAARHDERVCAVNGARVPSPDDALADKCPFNFEPLPSLPGLPDPRPQPYSRSPTPQPLTSFTCRAAAAAGVSSAAAGFPRPSRPAGRR
jgi:hypothetical protein